MQDYYEYWKIKRPVFTCLDIGCDYFVAENHRGIIKRVMFFCQQGSPLLLISSSAGHGKTTLARWIYDQLPTDTHEVLIVNLLESPKGHGWLMQRIAHFFGNLGEDLLAQSLSVLDELIEEEKKLLVIIDNAQHMTTSIAMDEIASFMQLQSLSQNHLSFLLLSDGPLQANLVNHPLGRHISFTGDLTSLSLNECKSFLQFQLINQGLPEDLFTDDAIYVLHEVSKGIYRQISTIAENCLMEAFIAEEENIKPTAVIKAASYVVGIEEEKLLKQYIPQQSSLPPIKSQALRPLGSSHESSAKAPKTIANPLSEIKLTDLLYDDDVS